MDADEVYAQLGAALRRLSADNERNEKSIAELGVALDTLIQIMQFRGEVGEGHLRTIAKLRERTTRAAQPHLELNTTVDKYQVENSEVDCGARMHLCHGRCCSFNVRLSRQDLKEGQLEFRIDEPYFLEQTAEGYCIYQTRETGFCGNYQYRPAPCRSYDCREDRRIWLDFEQMIPAPMPEELVTIRRNPKLASEPT
ncbi:MAG: YkgJ family cysteine cluster protein [Kofleriaceae bacterium]